MKHLTQYKLFEHVDLSLTPLNDDQAKLGDDILDVFMDVKDKWDIEKITNPYNRKDTSLFSYYMLFYKNSIVLRIDMYYLNLKLDFKSDMIDSDKSRKGLMLDLKNDFIKRLQKMGLDAFFNERSERFIEIKIEEKRKKKFFFI